MSEDSKAQAQALKEQGNIAYKARQFEEAASKYQAAWETDKDITCMCQDLLQKSVHILTL